MGGKKRRVSFSVPAVEKEEEEDVLHNVKVTVEDGDNVETMERAASDESSEDESGSTDGGAEAEINVTVDGDSDVEMSGSDSESSDDDEIDSEESEDASSDDSSSGEESEEEDIGPVDADGKPIPGAKAPEPVATFSEMMLDPRVERAVERIGWRKPTPVQSAVVPAALSGRDVLVSAPTGSGKTAAYAIPIVQHLCRARRTEVSGVRAVVLVPTRELAHQVATVLKMLCRYLDGTHVTAVTGRKNARGKTGTKGSGKRPRKAEAESAPNTSAVTDGDGEVVAFNRTADVLVGTPASIVAICGTGGGSALGSVEFVVVDEADLVLSYGYENDARAALAGIPPSAQAMLVSATLEADGMDSFRKVVLRRPLTVKVTTDGDMEDGDPTGATHYFAKLGSHKDRYLVTYAMLRLNVVCGKVLIFVNNVNAAFRLKLFLDQFKVKAAVLNSELPANSRMHCVEQFNAGVFDILVATDEAQQDDAGSSKKDKSKSMKKSHKKRNRSKDEEFGVSRGVDFRNVAAVLNFDIPESGTSYTHRAGRTARAGASGTVLSLVVDAHEQKSVVNMGRDLGVHIGPLAFRMDQIEAFRYRVEDCFRMVTDGAVNVARLADVRREIVNSERLKDYFEDNPQDLDALQHDLALAKHVPEHLAHIPSYLLPPALRSTVSGVPIGSRFKTKRRGGLRKKGSKVSASRGQRKDSDPLKNFSAIGDSGTSRERFVARHGVKKKTNKQRGAKKGRR